METFTPSTHFVTNMKVESGTGVAIYNKLKYVMNKKSKSYSSFKSARPRDRWGKGHDRDWKRADRIYVEG